MPDVMRRIPRSEDRSLNRQSHFYARMSAIPYGWRVMSAKVRPTHADFPQDTFRKALSYRFIEADPREQQTILRARQLRKLPLSYDAVASRLHEEGMVSRTGRRFSRTQIKRMILMELVSGHLVPGRAEI